MQQQQQSPTEAVEAIKRELIEAYAARAQADEKIAAIRNVLAGVGLGVEVQKQAPPAPIE